MDLTSINQSARTDEAINGMAIARTAIEIAREAGSLLKAGYGQAGTIDSKSSSIDLVTEYDLAAEKLITGRLREAFPTHTLIGEEGGQSNTGAGTFTWYIDPLDGTNNFAHALPVFAVSLGLYAGDTGLVGVVYDPMRDECFYAARDHGAFLQVGQQEAVRLSVGRATSLGQSLVATGFPYDRHTSSLDNAAQLAVFLKQVQGLRRMGSAALDLAYVAAGRLDGYWEFKLHHWDISAGILLVSEAGGKVTDTDGQPVQMNAERPSLIAANEQIHGKMLTVLRRVDAEMGQK